MVDGTGGSRIIALNPILSVYILESQNRLEVS